MSKVIVENRVVERVQGRDCAKAQGRCQDLGVRFHQCFTLAESLHQDIDANKTCRIMAALSFIDAVSSAAPPVVLAALEHLPSRLDGPSSNPER